MDWYLGIKPVTGKITWDLGVIYYTYPNGATRPRHVRVQPRLQLRRAQGRCQRRDLEGRHARRDGLLLARLPATRRVGVDDRGHVRAGLAEVQALHREWTPSFSALIGYQAGHE